MICPNCGADCSENSFNAYPLYPKGDIVCGKCVFKVFAIKQDCRTTGINYTSREWSYYPIKPL